MYWAGAGLGWSGAWVLLCAWACLWVTLLSVGARGHVAAASAVQSQQGVSRPVCRGLHKVEVDWWVMLKHPKGYQYSYIDSNSVSSSTAGSCVRGACWRHGLTMQNPNPVSHTLEELTTGTAVPATAAVGDSLAYVVYNDADPGGTEHFLFAHAKVSVHHMLSGGWFLRGTSALESQQQQQHVAEAGPQLCRRTGLLWRRPFLDSNSGAPDKSAASSLATSSPAWHDCSCPACCIVSWRSLSMMSSYMLSWCSLSMMRLCDDPAIVQHAANISRCQWVWNLLTIACCCSCCCCGVSTGCCGVQPGWSQRQQCVRLLAGSQCSQVPWGPRGPRLDGPTAPSDSVWPALQLLQPCKQQQRSSSG